ncbi:hypothetical protein PLESTB_001557100 [Pleodorina starrii]|uniref:PhoD-like phosphatase domain-containing protein n=1 Tax=Pleodorina starrii TaxID=330485 RepID=A0A9W6BX86_9CHLO|nr:hypothetical protein PLESTM_001473100 [Pleodorina starrii]GLC59949.1 hypothetical protein PLESTB_001557100 [Pleodorina starrii]GLC72823.1 hypothetical protein PLESTF_001297000 [Pleodorina starrii]
MGCAASMPTVTQTRTSQASGAPGALPGATTRRNADTAEPPRDSAAPNPFLEYYTLASLCGREVFGPFLKLRSYNPDTGGLELSVLVLCTEAVQNACQGRPRISWWESSGDTPPQCGAGAPTASSCVGGDEAWAAVEGVGGLESDAVRSTDAGARESGCGGGGRGGESGDGCDRHSRDGRWLQQRPQQGAQQWEQQQPQAPQQPEPGPGPQRANQQQQPQQQPQQQQHPPKQHSKPKWLQRKQQTQRQEQQQQYPEQAGTAGGRSAEGELLFCWRHWRFWRFRLDTTCGQAPKQLHYQVGPLLPGRTHTVAVPALEEPWRLAFYSCNGLDISAEHRHRHLYHARPAEARAFALWRDVARRHAQQPLHLLLGGGDQLYNDGVFEGPLLKGWDQAQDTRDAAAKAAIPFTDAMAAEVEEFYFSHYAAHWSQPVYAELFASVPSFSMWDDHDIVDGWGSYHDLINESAIMTGVFTASRTFYLLFQHHTTLERLRADGYWCEPAGCALLRLGSSAALLAADTRTCRTQQRVLPPDFLAAASERLAALPGEVRHVVVLLGGPLVYPRLPVQDALQKLDELFTGNTLVSVIMQKTGLASQVTRRFGMIEFLDDVIDQWSAHQHTAERDALLETLLALAVEKRFRVTLLSGDVHCAGYGMLHGRGDVPAGGVALMAPPRQDALATDPRFIPQIISSAIVNVPPPAPLLKLLCLAGRKAQPVLQDCVMRMLPLFGPANDADSLLHGRRNWCEATLGGPGDHLAFAWRCEKELGSEEVEVFSVTVPPLSDG